MIREASEPGNGAQPEVFVSYARPDTERVLSIAQLLEQEGTTIWRDEDRILGGQYYGEQIVHAIAHSKVVMLMCSPQAFHSDNVHREVLLTWDHYHRRYLPVWLSAAMEIPERFRYALAGCQWIDAHSQPSERWLPQMLKALHAMGVETTRPGGPAPIEATPRSDDVSPEARRRRLRFKPGDRPIQGADWVVERLLGKGGFGEVWMARNPHLPRMAPVALKFCVDLDARSRELLRHEANMVLQAQAQIRSDGIVPLLHAYLNNDPPCLEFPYIEGGTLVRLFDECREKAGAFTPSRAQRIIHHIAQIVTPAHRATTPLVHRDLKPSNVLVERRPEGKLIFRITDFGIGAIAAQPVLDRSRSTSSLEGSLSSVLTGAYSPLYASPQQMKGDKADPRDDVYALGVIWYQLLQGDLTIPAPAGRRWMKALEDRGMSEAAIELLSSCFESDPVYRPADSGVLAEQLQALSAFGQSREGEAPTEPGFDAARTEARPPETAQPLTSTTAADSVIKISPVDVDPSPVQEPLRTPEPSRPPTYTRPSWRSGGFARLVAASMFGLAGMFGIVVYVATDNGTVKITGSDHRMKIAIDGGEIRIENLGQPITVRTGEHKLVVERDGLTFKTESFQIQRGKERVLDVTYIAPPERPLEAAKKTELSPAEREILEKRGSAAAKLIGAPSKAADRPVLPTAADRATSRREGTASAAASTSKATVLSSPEYIVTMTGRIKLRLIPAGEFMMGSDETDPDAYNDEFLDSAGAQKKKHRVRITHPFYLGVTEVTRGQFREFVDDAGYKTDAEKDGNGGYGWNEKKKTFEQDPKFTWLNPGFDQTDEHPVVNVSWNDAVAFCEWLSRKDGKTFRLPTEAQWEYACRAGANSRYSFGDDPEALASAGNVADGTAKEKYPSWTTIAARDGYVYRAPVGRFQANAWGLYDMHGNVWEWCWDGCGEEYYKQSPVDDPAGVDGAANRVLRGGSWYDDPRFARSAYRGRDAPGYRLNDQGFRLALVQSVR